MVPTEKRQSTGTHGGTKLLGFFFQCVNGNRWKEGSVPRK